MCYHLWLKKCKVKTLYLKFTPIVVLYIITPNCCIPVWWLAGCLSNPSTVWLHYLKHLVCKSLLHKLQRHKIPVLMNWYVVLGDYTLKLKLQLKWTHQYYIIIILLLLKTTWDSCFCSCASCTVSLEVLHLPDWSSSPVWFVVQYALKTSSVKGYSVFFHSYTVNQVNQQCFLFYFQGVFKGFANFQWLWRPLWTYETHFLLEIWFV